MLATWYVVTAPTHDSFWRTYWPAKAVGARVASIPKEDAEQILTQPNTSDSLPWSFKVEHLDGRIGTIRTERGWKRFNKEKRVLRSLSADFPLHEGTALFRMPGIAASILAASMRKQGIRTVAESDDNVFATDKNLTLRIDTNEEWKAMHAKCMASFDACVFSTPDLRDAYAKEFKDRLQINSPEMHVALNGIDERDWPERTPRTGPLRVGFMGTSSHVWDVNVLYASFQIAKELGCETHMIGYNPGEWPIGPLPEKAHGNVKKWASVVDKHTRWIEPEEFRKHGLPLDIALCPLRADHFTFCKSDVKAIEATISGAAVVASNIPVFNRHWRHEETCLLANSYVEFAQATRRLIQDAKLRYELVTAAQEYVLAERGRKQMRHQWREALIG